MKSEPYSCNICGTIFVNKKELAKHRALVHATNEDEKMFQCQSCSMFFSSKEDFERHAIEAHSEKSPSGNLIPIFNMVSLSLLVPMGCLASYSIQSLDLRYRTSAMILFLFSSIKPASLIILNLQTMRRLT